MRMIHVAVLLYTGAFRPAAPVEGSYVVRTMNGKALPAELRIPSTAGAVRLFRLEQGVLTLKPGGRFTLYFRYYHQLVQRGARPIATPVLSDSEKGTYTLNTHGLMLTPAKRDGARSRPNIPATLTGDEISASYVLSDRTLRHRVVLVLRRDPRFW